MLKQRDDSFQSQIRQIPFFYFNRRAREWSPVHPSDRDDENGKQLSKPSSSLPQFPQKLEGPSQTLALLTLNVMYDKRDHQSVSFSDQTNIKYSKQRYLYILNALSEENVDIVTLNEVTYGFLQLMEDDAFVRQNYYVSTVTQQPKSETKYTSRDLESKCSNKEEVPPYKSYIKQFGNVILSKLRPVSVQIHYLPHLKKRPAITFSLKLSSKLPTLDRQKALSISISSIHLSSRKQNINQRKDQIQHLLTQLTDKNQLNEKSDYLIFVGDTNLHSEEENFIYERLGMVDFWKEFHESDVRYKSVLTKDAMRERKGYTFDSVQNLMINELYWGIQKRQMRLDRVLFFQNLQSGKLLPSKGQNKQIESPSSQNWMSNQTKENKSMFSSEKQNHRTKNVRVNEAKLIFNQPIYKEKENAEKQKSEPNRDPFMGLGTAALSFVFDAFHVNILRKKQSYLFPSDHFGIKMDLNLETNLGNQK